MVRPKQLEGFKSQAGFLGPTSVACRAVRVGLVESAANSFSKDDVPSAAGSNAIGTPLAEKATKPINR